MQLPFVLQSAETMKTAVAYLEPHMEKADAGGKGMVVLATVKGDVHDIGKNLVDIILTNNGYMVYNLGIKIAINEMIDKALEVNADAIGMSGLLVKRTIIMRENLAGAEHARARRHACRCCSAAPRSRATTSSATCARSTTAASSTARTRSRACARWTRCHGRQEAATLDPAFGREAGGRNLPPRKSAARRGRADGRDPGPLRRRDRREDLHAAVRRFARRQGHLARRHRRLRQRDRAVPQPVAVPAREGRARTTRTSRRASGPTFREQLGIAKQEHCSCPRPRGATSR